MNLCVCILCSLLGRATACQPNISARFHSLYTAEQCIIYICMNVCMHICSLHVDIYVCRHTSRYISEYGCMYICSLPDMHEDIYVYIFLCMNVCMYMCCKSEYKYCKNECIPVSYGIFTFWQENTFITPLLMMSLHCITNNIINPCLKL